MAAKGDRLRHLVASWWRRFGAYFRFDAEMPPREVQVRPQAAPPAGPLPAPEEPVFFQRTRFQGTLSGHGSSIPIGFDAWVDGLGLLHLELNRMPFSQEAYALHVDQRPGSPVDLLVLEGVSEAGHRFSSDSFSISQFRHGSEPGEELSYQGDCYDAELTLPADRRHDTSHDTRAWRVRQFRTFRRIAHDTPLGRVIIGGPKQDRDSQDPNGSIALHRPQGDTSDIWWSESDRLLTHVARVMSFACDTYLRPVIEERYDNGQVTVRIASQGRTSAPFMAPFYDLHMEPIFAFACDSFFSRYDEFEQLDAAIRWLTAPVAYDESRLINAMSALENILARCGLDEIGVFLGNSEFKQLAKEVRKLLKALKAPAGMSVKVAELNRRSLAEKVSALLQARGIVVSDMPEDWLDTIIRQRNIIVHTGISQDFGDLEPDTLDHTIWAREIVTRIILERLGFVGAYRSWLHHDEQLHFPECMPMEAWLRQQEAEAAQLAELGDGNESHT